MWFVYHILGRLSLGDEKYIYCKLLFRFHRSSNNVQGPVNSEKKSSWIFKEWFEVQNMPKKPVITAMLYVQMSLKAFKNEFLKKQKLGKQMILANEMKKAAFAI